MGPFSDEQQQMLARLDLSMPPFSPEPDSSFMFLAGSVKNVLAQIQNVTSRQLGPVVVEGEAGCGKTMLARKLLELYSGQMLLQPIYLAVMPGATGFEVMSALATQLGARRRRSASQLLDEFRAWFKERRLSGHATLILLDDAHLLQPEALDMLQFLLELEPQQTLAQVVVFGQAELYRLLALRPGLLQRMRRLTLTPLLPPEAMALVNFRCQVAGRVQPLLVEASLDTLYAYTHGNPGLIVGVCAEVLPLLVRDHRMQGDEQTVAEAVQHFERTRQQPPPPPAPPAKRGRGRPRKDGPRLTVLAAREAMYVTR